MKHQSVFEAPRSKGIVDVWANLQSLITYKREERAVLDRWAISAGLHTDSLCALK